MDLDNNEFYVIGMIISKGIKRLNKRGISQQQITVLDDEMNVNNLWLFGDKIEKVEKFERGAVLAFECWLRTDKTKNNRQIEYNNVRSITLHVNSSSTEYSSLRVRGN